MKRDMRQANHQLQQRAQAANRASRNRIVRQAQIGEVGGSTTPPSQSTCPRVMATVRNAARRTVNPFEILYLDREDQDPTLLEQTKEQAAGATTEIQVVDSQFHAATPPGSVGPTPDTTYVYQLPEGLQANDLILAFGEAASGAGDVLTDAVWMQMDIVNGPSSLGEIYCTWGDLLPPGATEIDFGNHKHEALIVLVLRNVRRLTPTVDNQHGVSIIGNWNNSWVASSEAGNFDFPAIAYTPTAGAVAITFLRTRSANNAALIEGPFVAPTEESTGIASPREDIEEGTYTKPNHAIPGVGPRIWADLERLDGSGSYQHANMVRETTSEDTGSFSSRLYTATGVTHLLEPAASQSNPTPPPTSCATMIGSDIRMVEAITSPQGTKGGLLAARSRLEQDRRRQPLLATSVVPPGQTGSFIVEGFGTCCAYLSDPSHRFLGPPPTNAFRERYLDTPTPRGVYGYLGGYYEQGANREYPLSQYFVGQPQILYSQAEPSPVRIIHAWRAGAPFYATQPVAAQEVNTLTVDITRTAGVLTITAATLLNQLSAPLTTTIATDGNSVTGDLMENWLPTSHRPYYPNLNAATSYTDPSETMHPLTHGSVSNYEGLWTYNLSQASVGDLTDGQTVQETFLFYEAQDWLSDPVAASHPWMYANPETANYNTAGGFPAWPEFPTDNLTPASAYERAASTETIGVNAAFDPYLGRELEPGEDARLGLQYVYCRLTGDAFGDTDCC